MTDIDILIKLIRKSKSIKDKAERLDELRNITEDIGNNFTEAMSYIEDEIDFVLERTPRKIKDELGYHEVADITQDINVICSWEYSR